MKFRRVCENCGLTFGSTSSKELNWLCEQHMMQTGHIVIDIPEPTYIQKRLF